MSHYREDDTVEEYSQAYVDVLNGPPNGWGQHRCPKTNLDSTSIHWIGRTRYGEEAFNAACTAIFRKNDNEKE